MADESKSRSDDAELGGLLDTYGRTFHAAKMEEGRNGTQERADRARHALVAFVRSERPLSREPVAWRYRLRSKQPHRTTLWRYVESIEDTNPSLEYEVQALYERDRLP